EHDRNCCGYRFRRRCPGHASREDRADPASNQIGREGPQTIILAFRPSIFDRQVATFDIADFAQSLMESTQPGRITVGRCALEKTDRWHRSLLRPGRERPHGRRAAKNRDELAPFHSITSSAMASSLSGIWRPSALAVLRLTARSNLVGNATGKSAGLRPLRILST